MILEKGKPPSRENANNCRDEVRFELVAAKRKKKMTKAVMAMVDFRDCVVFQIT